MTRYLTAEEHLFQSERVKVIQRRKVAHFNDIKRQLICEECGDRRWYLLDFHHRNGRTGPKATRRWKSITHMARFLRWEKVLEEIARCDILCANCHRERHYREEKRCPESTFISTTRSCPSSEDGPEALFEGW